MNEEEFHGISLHWMREMWRDCKDREEQLIIFQDMTGAGVDEILQALGTDWKSKRKVRAGSRRPWTAEEEEKLREMKAAGIREKEIAAEMGRTMNAVHARWCILHPEAYGKAEDLPEEAVGAPEAEEAFPAVPDRTRRRSARRKRKSVFGRFRKFPIRGNLRRMRWFCRSSSRRT